MKFISSIVLALLLSLPSQAQISIEDVANSLSNERYGKLYRCFSDDMKQAVPKDRIKAIWLNLTATGGEFQALENITYKDREGGSFQTALIRFEELSMKLELSTNSDNEISGLMVRQLAYNPPKYAEGLGVGKKYINFTSDGYELPGELVIPLDCDKCPVVILVHGSGPNDKDETIGPNKVFYDLAMGLAKNGIASFRYDKRSKLYPEVLEKQFDIYDETINDAIAALQTIKADTSLFFGKHLFLGHSLGAYAMPIIADSLGQDLDGAILFSSNARRLEDLIEYQMDYLTNYDGELNSAEKKIIEENKLKAELIRKNSYTVETSAEDLLAYWPGKFWKGIDQYSPVEVLKGNSSTPFLIMQGEKDYQITMVDFKIWEDNVGDKENVTLKSYENLTHLFTPSTAKKPGPNDYFVPQNVSYEVIKDIVSWAKGL